MIRVPRNNGLASSLTYQQEIERLRKVIEEFKRYDKKRKDYYQALVTEHDILVQKNRELTVALSKKPSLDDVTGLSITDKKRFLKLFSSLSAINSQRLVLSELLQSTSKELKKLSADLGKLLQLSSHVGDALAVEQLTYLVQQMQLRFSTIRGRLNYVKYPLSSVVSSEETHVSSEETTDNKSFLQKNSERLLKDSEITSENHCFNL